MKKIKISRAAKVGMYGVSVFLMLYLGLNFIKSQDMFSTDNTYYAVYDKSDGIQASSPVTIKGFRVGTVSRVHYDVALAKVMVEFAVSNEYPIPADSEAKIVNTSIIGGKVVELYLGTSPELMVSGDTICSNIDPDLMQLATAEYDKLKMMAESLLERVSMALDGANALLSKQNTENLAGLLENLNSVSGNVDKMVATDLKKTMANLNNLTSELNASAPKISNIVDKMNGLADTMSVSIPTLMNSTALAMDKLNATMTAINNAEGSAGKLIHDQELYHNLTEASESMTLLLEDFKHNPGRYIHFSVFGGGTKNKDKTSTENDKELSRKEKKAERKENKK